MRGSWVWPTPRMSCLQANSLTILTVDALTTSHQLHPDALALPLIFEPSPLTAGHIFMTGLHGCPNGFSAGQEDIFLTRSPCVKPTDGRKLPLVMERPPGVSTSTWEWLLGLPFGAVIFSTLGERPLPATVADGDLDGDLYFACWDFGITSSVVPRALPSEAHAGPPTPVLLEENSGAFNAHEGGGQLDWLQQVQAYLCDTRTVAEGALIGQLYNLHERCADERGLDDPDALAYGAAYVQALEREKHGGAVGLPVHLHSEKLLRSVERSSIAQSA
jgi:hypothetical protein